MTTCSNVSEGSSYLPEGVQADGYQEVGHLRPSIPRSSLIFANSGLDPLGHTLFSLTLWPSYSWVIPYFLQPCAHKCQQNRLDKILAFWLLVRFACDIVLYSVCNVLRLGPVVCLGVGGRQPFTNRMNLWVIQIIFGTGLCVGFGRSTCASPAYPLHFGTSSLNRYL